MLSRQYKKRLSKLCKAYAAAVPAGLFLIFLSVRLGFGIPCVFHKLTGLNCPSCGVTRMIKALLYGDFYTAYSLNRLIFLSLPGFVFYIIRSSVQYVKYGKCRFSKTDNKIFIAFIVCAVIFGIVRNADVITGYIN